MNHAESDGAVRFGDLYGCNDSDFIFASYQSEPDFELANQRPTRIDLNDHDKDIQWRFEF